MALRISFPHDDDSVEVAATGAHDHEPKSLAELEALSEDVKTFIRAKMELKLTAGRIHVLLSVRVLCLGVAYNLPNCGHVVEATSSEDAHAEASPKLHLPRE